MSAVAGMNEFLAFVRARNNGDVGQELRTLQERVVQTWEDVERYEQRLVDLTEAVQLSEASDPLQGARVRLEECQRDADTLRQSAGALETATEETKEKILVLQQRIQERRRTAQAWKEMPVKRSQTDDFLRVVGTTLIKVAHQGGSK